MRYGRKGFRGKQQSKGWKEFNLKWALENWALSSMHGMFDEIVLQTLTKIEKGGGVLMWENDLDCHVVSFEEVIS